MKVHPAAALLLVLASTPSPCTGFSAGKPNQRKVQDFGRDVIEDAVVKDVAAKVRRGKPPSNNKPLNARQRSFTQRDPIISLNMNLDYLAKSGQRDASHRCEEMLTRIEALHEDGYYEKAPDVVSYNSVINSYAHGRATKNSRRGQAKQLMRRMEEKGIAPNTITWNTLLRCILKEVWERKWERTSMVEEAEFILADMEASGLANTISYNTVISIISKSRLEDSAERAERWLQRMIELHATTQSEKVQPDTTSFNGVIHAYANTSTKARGAPERANRAEELIQQMETLHQSGEYDSVKPDVVSYSALVNALSRAAFQDEECASRAMEVLDRMIELYEGGDKGVKPNKRTYTSVINALGRVGKPETADEILSKMKERYETTGDHSLKPDTVCYSSVLDAYAKKGGEEAAYRCEELLEEMEDLYNNGDNDTKPNAQTYRSVITALGKSKAPRAAEKAELILNEMEFISSHGAKDLAPNTIVYNAVIDAFARSKSVSKAYRAELLLEKMLEESEEGNTSIRPDTITFNSVINAAARSTYGDAIVRNEAYLIGLNAFKNLHSSEHCQPTAVTYVSFLQLLKNLVEPGDARDQMAERSFKLSCSLGLANDAVVSQLRKTCSPLVAQRILSSGTDP